MRLGQAVRLHQKCGLADTKFWGKLVVYVRYSTDFTDQENDGPFSSGLPDRSTAAPDTESGRCLLSYA